MIDRNKTRGQYEVHVKNVCDLEIRSFLPIIMHDSRRVVFISVEDNTMTTKQIMTSYKPVTCRMWWYPRRTSVYFCVLALALSIFPASLFATPPLEWSLTNGRDADYHPFEDVNESSIIAPRVIRDYEFQTHYNYFYELRQIAAFLADWQVLDPGSPDFGGMIEAEAGELGDVIQTDNTLEAIIAWSKYAMVFQDTSTYGDFVRRAWTYCTRYPAWREEGDPGDDYYRNHNCAWGVWASLTYESVYGDDSHAAYAESSAAYMVAHPMPFAGASGSYQWINPFVTGWMAGNLYLYGEALENAALMDTAAGMGNRVKNWIEEDPESRMAEERWAMSSGTAVWGVCNSLFRSNPELAESWIAEYGPLMDEFQPWRNAPDDGYDWDNAWNVAYANAHHAMYLLSNEGQYGANFQSLADTLLSYDTDDDGGIPATTRDPVTEDMTWVSSYLWLMGVHGIATHLPDNDTGVLALEVSTSNPPYHVGDSISVSSTFANFGWNAQAIVDGKVVLNEPTGDTQTLTWSWSMDRGENIAVEHTWAITSPGLHRIIATSSCTNDESDFNDSLMVQINVLPVIPVQGRLIAEITGDPISGRISAIYAGTPEPIPYDTCYADPINGTWSIDLPAGEYELDVSPRLPFPEMSYFHTVVNPSTEVFIHVEDIADLIIVDDDDGEDLESYILDSCDSLEITARCWDRMNDPVPMTEHLLEYPEIPVLWLNGEATSNALEPMEQDSLVRFVHNGGLLILTGQNTLEFGGDGPLFEDIFPVSFFDNSFDHILDIDPTDPVTLGYSNVGTAGQGSANNQRAQDILTMKPLPVDVTGVPFVHFSPDEIAGLRFEGRGGNRMLFGFGIEGIGLPNQPAGFIPRHVFLARCLAWLSGTSNLHDVPHPVPERPILFIGPNPSNGIFTIHYVSRGSPRFIPFRMYDLSGRLVRTEPVHILSGKSTHTVDSGSLPNGMYHCTMGSSEARNIIILR